MPIPLHHTAISVTSIAKAAVAHAEAPLPAAFNDAAWTSRFEDVLGTSMHVTLRAADQAMAEKAQAALLAEIDRHDLLLSAWRPESELNRWLRTRGSAEAVSPEVYEVLGLFDHWHAQTGGAIDASVQAAVRMWEMAVRQQRQPTAAEIAEAVAAMQQPHWKLEAEGKTATRLSQTPLVLASFTKSYISGKAVDAALHAGASGAMLNIGGDIVVRGDLTQIVQVTNPNAHAENNPAMTQIALRDRSVATSGSYRRGFSATLRRAGDAPEFSHIIDPRTAQPADTIASSTVIAQEPATAGALATAFSILSVDESRKLAATQPGTEYLLITREGERIASDGWNNYEVPAPRSVSYANPQAAKRAPAAAEWNQNFELAIDLELPRFDSPRAHRPYLAVWIENADHFPVRTVALWYDKMRYLPEMREWARDNQMRTSAGQPEISQTVASATRSPGKYTLKFDGKDDEGKLLKPGKYTVCIEAAREHGGNQTERQEFDFNGTPQQHTLPAGEELGPVTLDYRKQ